MFLLQLNPMRDRSEATRIVARASTAEALRAFVERERVPPYIDTSGGGHGHEANPAYSWSKTFRQGGPLEWFNPPEMTAGDPIFQAISREGAMQRAAAEWDQFMLNIPSV